MLPIEVKLNDLFERFRKSLPQEVVREGLELVAHGECGVAHELLSQLLFENSVRITTDDLKDLQETASLTGLDPLSLEFLRPLLRSNIKS